MQITQEFYVLVSKDNIAQGMDRNSGGYPYDVKSLNQAHFWQSKEASEAYAKIFGGKYKVCPVIISVEL